MVRAERLRKRYRRGPEVLAGVDLTLGPGAPVVLAGANGSGKSTLLRIVAGATAPTAGRVRFRPRVVGYLPDRFPSGLRTPVDAYLRHLAAIRGVPVDTGLLDALGFTGSRTEPMARLSKGNAQKVGLAQALGCGAGLVVLDEPWAGLDAQAAATLAEVLDDTARSATLLVTDHTGRAARLRGVRRLALEQGRVHEAVDAPPSEVARDGVVVVLRSADPGTLRARLGVPGVVEGDRLRLRVDAGASDAVLLAALRAGASVEAVGPE